MLSDNSSFFCSMMYLDVNNYSFTSSGEWADLVSGPFESMQDMSRLLLTVMLVSVKCQSLQAPDSAYHHNNGHSSLALSEMYLESEVAISPTGKPVYADTVNEIRKAECIREYNVYCAESVRPALLK